MGGGKPLDSRLAVRCRLPVRPMPGSDPETTHPMHIEAALGAIEGEVLKLTFEIGLHLEQLQPEHLGVGDERIGPTVSDPDSLVTRSSAFAACSTMV
jgi:hypothetical protein